MKLNLKKLERQKGFIQKWIDNLGRGTLEACTGFGKSYVGTLAADLCNIRHAGDNIDIVVPSLYLQKKWQIDLIEHDIKNATVYVVNTYIKSRHECGLLILDEVHHYGSAMFREVFNVASYKWVLGLTATMERQDGEDALIRSYCPILETISLEEAEKEGFVAKHYIFNLGVDIDEEEKAEYDGMESMFKNKFKKFGWDFELAMACGIGNDKRTMLRTSKIPEANFTMRTGRQWREWYCAYMGGNPSDEEDDYHPKTIYSDAVMWSKAMRNRKSFIYQSKSKINVARNIINRFSSCKIMTFSQELESVDLLTKLLVEEDNVKAKSYHSKLGVKLKRQVLKDFNNNRARVLNTAKALDEGYDVHDIDMVIQLSYTSTKRQDVQRTGRGIRFQEGKIAYIINIYLRGTQEESWLKSKQKDSKPAIEINSVNEIPML